MPKNNSDISRDIERIRHEEALQREIKDLRAKLYEADKRVVGLMVDNDKLKADNLQLISQIGGGE